MKINISVPVGKKGLWEIQEFTVSTEAAAFENMRSRISFSSRPIESGTYKRLVRSGIDTIMSNTPMEIQDFMQFVRRARGHVLINGLGLGVLLTALLEKVKVDSVTVIEKEKDVIDLVAPTFAKDLRVEIIHADAYKWKPPMGIRYDCAWHDIWDNICADNLEGMTKLHRKYGRRVDYQDSWCKRECLRNRGY